MDSFKEDIKAIKHFFNNNDEESAVKWLKEKSKNYIKLMSYYKCAMMEIETKLNVLNEEFSLEFDRNPISSVKSRLKRPESVIEKVERKGLPKSIQSVEDNICDVAGIRVICSFCDDVYMVADALLKQDDVELIKKKDYIKNPKPNGYRSLHLIVATPIYLANEKRKMKVEIQLRTISMDFWASLEHQMKYKKDNMLTTDMENELRDLAEQNTLLDIRMQNLRKQIDLLNCREDKKSETPA